VVQPALPVGFLVANPDFDFMFVEHGEILARSARQGNTSCGTFDRLAMLRVSSGFGEPTEAR
jgi:hypothetical protein